MHWLSVLLLRSGASLVLFLHCTCDCSLIGLVCTVFVVLFDQGDGKEHDVLGHLQPSEYRAARKCIIKAILSTDMAHHADICRYTHSMIHNSQQT